MSVRVDIITYNIRHALHQPAVDEDVNAITRLGVHYLGFQEIHGEARSKRLETTVAENGYGCVRYTTIPGDYKTPIAYKASQKILLDSGTEFLSGPTGPEGAGPATKVDKRATWGLFRDRSSKNMEVVINCHLPASPHVFQRGVLHKEAVGNLTQLAKRLRREYEADTFIIGDMNTDYYKIRGKARFKDLEDLGFKANWGFFAKDIPSFPSKKLWIDWVLSNAVPRDQSVMLGYNSDHRPVRVRY